MTKLLDPIRIKIFERENKMKFSDLEKDEAVGTGILSTKRNGQVYILHVDVLNFPDDLIDQQYHALEPQPWD